MPLIRSFAGVEIAPHLPALAELRMRVFRDWPYLYDGDAQYEERYLRSYRDSWRSVVVLAFDGGRVVGASTGLPLSDETDEIRAAFEGHLVKVEHVIPTTRAGRRSTAATRSSGASAAIPIVPNFAPS